MKINVKWKNIGDGFIQIGPDKSCRSTIKNLCEVRNQGPFFRGFANRQLKAELI
jgi:hypothetical protein